MKFQTSKQCSSSSTGWSAELSKVSYLQAHMPPCLFYYYSTIILANMIYNHMIPEGHDTAPHHHHRQAMQWLKAHNGWSAHYTLQSAHFVHSAQCPPTHYTVHTFLHSAHHTTAHWVMATAHFVPATESTKLCRSVSRFKILSTENLNCS